MTRIKSALTAKSGEREANAAEWRRLVDELNLRRRAAAGGGSSKACERHVARGKFLARERVEGREWLKADEEAFRAPIRAKYEAEGFPYFATARLRDDGIVTPQETRRFCRWRFRQRSTPGSSRPGSASFVCSFA